MDIIKAVELAKNGDNTGITFLYEETYQKGYYIALKYLKNEYTAQDVLQDSYIKAFQNLNQLEDASKFEGWFGRIVATRSLNELKKNNPMLFSETETEDESDISDTFEDDRIDTCPELAIDQQETTRLIQDMMAELSDEQRMCITMFYMEEMSVKEIAETLGVSENTVKSRLNYGRTKIKDKVLELEKKGTKLYGLLPMVFFIALFKKDALACEITVPAASSVLSGVGAAKATAATTATSTTSTASAAASATAGAAKAGLAIGGTTISTKAVIAAVTAAVVLAGSVGVGAAVINRPDTEVVETAAEAEQFDAGNDIDEVVETEDDVIEAVDDTENPEEDIIVANVLGSDEPTEEEAEAESADGYDADSSYVYLAGRYKSDNGDSIFVSIATDYDGEYPDGTLEGTVLGSDFGAKYLDPTSVNVYEVKNDWQSTDGTGYVLTGCDGGDTVKIYKDGKLVETFKLVGEHFYS